MCACVHELALPFATPVPVDGHVHFHELSNVARTLDAAAANFGRAVSCKEATTGAILLAQTSGEQVFEALSEIGVAERWILSTLAEEPESVMARAEDAAILIVCGRQVRTYDGLEVLALGTRTVFPDGLSLAEALSGVAQTDALPVVPWGFGKLTGRRGKSVRRLLAAQDRHTLFVGDNGSRLQMLGSPAFIRTSSQSGFRVLPGSDPFPIAHDFRRVGRFGFLAEATLDANSPWRSLRSWLAGLPHSPTPYGTACDAVHFLRIQAGIQLYKRFPWIHRP